jgi:hypothetical protein
MINSRRPGADQPVGIEDFDNGSGVADKIDNKGNVEK